MTHARDGHGASARILLLLTSIITLLMMPSKASAALPSWSFDAGTGVLSVSSSGELDVAPQIWNGGIDLGCYGCEGLITGVNTDDVLVIDITSSKTLSISPSAMLNLHNAHGYIKVQPHSPTSITVLDADAHPGNSLTFPTDISIIGNTLIARTPATDHHLKLDTPRISTFEADGTKFDDRIDLSRSSLPISGPSRFRSLDLNLGSGYDTVLGPPRLGDSQMYLGDGNDTIRMPTGNNRVFAGGGNDTITTGPGKDSITANAGNDTIRTGPGNDGITDLTGYTTFINSGSGDDFVEIATTRGTIHSGKGDDSLGVRRRTRRATINAGSGNDIVSYPQTLPRLTLNCGRGTDLIWYRRPHLKHCETARVE